MNIDRFISGTPARFNNWGTLDVSPIEPPVRADRTMEMSTPAVRGLINIANQFLDDGEFYLEVGVLRGDTFVSALVGNGANGIAVDNFSLFNSDHRNKRYFLRNIRRLGLKSRYRLYEQDYIEFFKNPPDVKVGVYFCDGPHGYDGTMNGLEMSIPILADRCVIFMDDFNANWDGVPQATMDWIAKHSNNAKMIWDLSTPNGYGVWWNGLAVIEWRS